MLNFDYSKDIGRLVLYSETFGADVDCGIVIESNKDNICIQWFKRKRKEYLAKYILYDFVDKGMICFVK